MRVESTRMRVESTRMRVESTRMRVDACRMRVVCVSNQHSARHCYRAVLRVN
jgi:hypothetical protein